MSSSVQRENEMELPISWIRGDAGGLPFSSGVLDAVHWGAAMHCVPDVEQALEEVYLVLKPGGRLYAITFLRPFPDVVFRFFYRPRDGRTYPKGEIWQEDLWFIIILLASGRERCLRNSSCHEMRRSFRSFCKHNKKDFFIKFPLTM
jgi:ubiquinone/menaquinone biosynthesis C-methylase UbiE